MENKNNIELEEMKAQWDLLQDKLTKQEELNKVLVLDKAKNKSKWVVRFLRIVAVIGFVVALPACYIFSLAGLPKSACIFIGIVVLIDSIFMLISSFLIPNPSDARKSISEINNSLIKFRKSYLSAMVLGAVSLIIFLIWILASDIEIDGTFCAGLVGGTIGFIVGLSLDRKVLHHIKGIREDLELIRNWK